MKQTTCFLFICFFTEIITYGQTATNRTAYFPKQEEIVLDMQNKNNTWVFIMAGQSNMAGRGLVEPQDTVSNERVFTINKHGSLILAKEPIHFYESSKSGLDCGLSFGKHLLSFIPDSINILIIPTAIGGSSIQKWLGDSTFRGIKLLSNFREKVEIGQKYGEIKAILWHQGESNAREDNAILYGERLLELISTFRAITFNDTLPILVGELGSYSPNSQWKVINQQIRNSLENDTDAMIIPTSDFQHIGDSTHFNSESQRLLGERFAKEYKNYLNYRKNR